MKKLLVCGLGSGYGGVSNVIMNVLRDIPQGTWDITVVETYDSVYHDEILELGNKIIKFPPFKKYFRYKKAVKKFLKDNPFDAVWINNTAKVDLVIMKFAKKQGAKIITHSHGSIQEGSKLKRVVFEIINKLNEKKFYSYLDYGIACSQSSADYFYNKRYLKDKNLCILTNAISCEKYAFSEELRDIARSEFGVGQDDIVLACIGRICAVKNLGFAIEVIEKLPENYKLVIIGGGDAESLKLQISERRLEEKVLLLGERSDINVLLNGIDILLLPSISEGLPMIVLEAQANGIKCIISDKVSTECKALDNAEFVPIEDAQNWAEVILNADHHRVQDSVTIMQNKGFDIKDYSRKLLEIVDSCVK